MIKVICLPRKKCATESCAGAAGSVATATVATNNSRPHFAPPGNRAHPDRVDPGCALSSLHSRMFYFGKPVPTFPEHALGTSCLRLQRLQIGLAAQRHDRDLAGAEVGQDYLHRRAVALPERHVSP